MNQKLSAGGSAVEADDPETDLRACVLVRACLCWRVWVCVLVLACAGLRACVGVCEPVCPSACVALQGGGEADAER